MPIEKDSKKHPSARFLSWWEVLNKTRVFSGPKQKKKRYNHRLVISDKIRVIVDFLKKYPVYWEETEKRVSRKEALIKMQKGACAGCGLVPESPSSLALDHDHKNGLVRGLLCSNCNLVLGNSFERGAVLINLARYLSYWHKQTIELEKKKTK